MKRLFYSAGIVLTLSFFGSCAQHDPNSPDTSGAVPYGSSEGGNRVGVDTITTGLPTGTGAAGGTNSANAPNMNNDQTNATKQSSTFDSVDKKQ